MNSTHRGKPRAIVVRIQYTEYTQIGAGLCIIRIVNSGYRESIIFCDSYYTLQFDTTTLIGIPVNITHRGKAKSTAVNSIHWVHPSIFCLLITSIVNSSVYL